GRRFPVHRLHALLNALHLRRLAAPSDVAGEEAHGGSNHNCENDGNPAAHYRRRLLAASVETGSDRRTCGRLADGPGIATIEEPLEIAVPLPLLRPANLLRHDAFVGGTLDGAKDTDRRREIGRSDQTQEECECAVLLVVDEQVGCG